MKQLLLSGLLAFALVLSACERQSSVNDPVASDNGASFSKIADRLNLSLEQLGQIDEMYYLGEDLSTLLTPEQLNLLNTLSVATGDVNLFADPGDGRIPRGAFDMEALRIYRLILQANPDMSDEQKARLKAAIDESNKKRAEILMDQTKDEATKKTELEQLHKDLMTLIFGEDGMGDNGAVLDAGQVQRYKDLVTELEKKRTEERQKWLETRITRQIEVWTKLMNLNEEQQAKIKEILLGQAAEIDRLRQELKGQPDALREALKNLQTTTNDEIYKWLSPDQQAIWDKMHHRGGTGGGMTTGIDREVQYWTKLLGLDETQASALRSALEQKQKATQEAMTTLRGQPTELRAALQKINDEFEAALKASFTQEQYDKWVKMHTKPGGRG